MKSKHSSWSSPKITIASGAAAASFSRSVANPFSTRAFFARLASRSSKGTSARSLRLARTSFHFSAGW